MLFKESCAMGIALCLVVGCQSSINEIVEQTYPDGSRKKVSYYSGSRRNIIKTFFYFSDGKVQSEQYFKNGLPDSVLIIYYPDGSKYKETGFSMGKRHGADRSWFEGGALKTDARFENDQCVGKFVQYFEDGKIWVETPYVNGKKEGEDIEYFTGGEKKKTLKTYFGGDANGIEKEWYENGNLKMEQMWKDNVLNGSFATYYRNGKKKEEGTYKDGAYDGKRFMYDEQGRKKSWALYEKGALIDGRAL